MKRTLASQRIQDWCLLDLRPMHRALLRRIVDPPHKNIESQPESAIEFRWHQESIQGTDEQRLVAILRRPGVIVFDRQALAQRIVENRTVDPLLAALHDRCPDQIRLLWHWALRGKQDILWCTEMGFDGVINDPKSLDYWSRCCRRKAKVVEGQSNLLLSGIQLPSLAVPNPTVT